MVNVKGEDKEKLACAVKVTDGMVITTDSDELFKKRKAIVEEMFRQHTVDCHHCIRLTHSNWSAAFSRSVIPSDAAICTPIVPTLLPPAGQRPQGRHSVCRW